MPVIGKIDTPDGAINNEGVDRLGNDEPKARLQRFLALIAGVLEASMKPKSRLERYLNRIVKRLTAEDLKPKSGCELYLGEIADMAASMIVPEGAKDITTNGAHNVAAFETANVSVPASAVVSGTKSITTNGTHDVTNYASAEVNVAASVEFAKVNVVNNTGALLRILNSLTVIDGKLATENVEIQNGESGSANVDFSAFANNVDYYFSITIANSAEKTFTVSVSPSGTSASIKSQVAAGTWKLLVIHVSKSGISSSGYPTITISESE